MFCYSSTLSGTSCKKQKEKGKGESLTAPPLARDNTWTASAESFVIPAT